jgi:hypothetical protein
MVIPRWRPARDLFCPNVLVCVELRDARVLFLERSQWRERSRIVGADLFLMRCTTTFHLTPLMVPSLRGSALSMLSIHALDCTFSLFLSGWVDAFSVTLASPTHQDASGREVQRWAAADRHCCLWSGRWASPLSLLLCRKGIRATTQAPPLVLRAI